jgi:hypothetical protein
VNSLLHIQHIYSYDPESHMQARDICLHIYLATREQVRLILRLLIIHGTT